MRVKMDWAKSPPVMVIATDDDSDVVELEAVSSELAGVLYTFFRPSKVWQLHRRGTTPG
ncbi:MAG: hypothetical protein U5R31_17325 [Acidimicrobiia bacterium]|nr:hypothetical protein [Acidimicrobiia bacterium]